MKATLVKALVKTRLRGDTGSASLWMVAVSMLVWAAAAATVVAGSAINARHQAGLAADLAALAGATAADRVGVGPGTSTEQPAASTLRQARSVACAAAAEIAEANDARLADCGFSAGIITVTATVSLHLPSYFGAPSVDASARAGPA